MPHNAATSWAALALLGLVSCGDSDAAASSRGDTATMSAGASSSSADATTDIGATTPGSTAGSTAGPTAGPTGDASSSASGDVTSSSGQGSESDTDDVEAPLAVLFIGNSYTFVNDLPALLDELADARGAPRIVSSAITQGGARFLDHNTNPAVHAAIDAGDHDFVILQGQSYEPIYDAISMSEAHEHALALAERVQDAGGEPVFFETWARAPGHELYLEPWSGGDPAAMQALLHQAYSGYANDSMSTLAPVGQAWIDVLLQPQEPAIELYTADGSHPSIAGSYLAACVFYTTLTGQSPLGAAWPPELDENTAMILQDAAASAALP